MKLLKFFASLCLMLMFCCGCNSRSGSAVRYSNLPWARPAPWEYDRVLNGNSFAFRQTPDKVNSREGWEPHKATENKEPLVELQLKNVLNPDKKTVVKVKTNGRAVPASMENMENDRWRNW